MKAALAVALALAACDGVPERVRRKLGDEPEFEKDVKAEAQALVADADAVNACASEVVGIATLTCDFALAAGTTGLRISGAFVRADKGCYDGVAALTDRDARHTLASEGEIPLTPDGPSVAVPTGAVLRVVLANPHRCERLDYRFGVGVTSGT